MPKNCDFIFMKLPEFACIRRKRVCVCVLSFVFPHQKAYSKYTGIDKATLDTREGGDFFIGVDY
jgi:hypothetical protein